MHIRLQRNTQLCCYHHMISICCWQIIWDAWSGWSCRLRQGRWFSFSRRTITYYLLWSLCYKERLKLMCLLLFYEVKHLFINFISTGQMTKPTVSNTERWCNWGVKVGWHYPYFWGQGVQGVQWKDAYRQGKDANTTEPKKRFVL